MPTLSERKVIKGGPRTLLMTLPKAWTDYYRVWPGDVVRVVATDDTLVVYSPQKSPDDVET